MNRRLRLILVGLALAGVSGGIITQIGGSPAGAAVKVGAPTPTSVTCTQTLNVGQNVNTALVSASPGAVVCLNPGAWSSLSLSTITPASCCVTLAATPGQTVSIPGIELSGSTASRNLVIEGFNITQAGPSDLGINLSGAISGGVTIQYNTIENQPQGAGIYSNPEEHGGTNTQTGVTIQYNQIDHAGGGLQLQTPLADTNFTIAHNVIGPDIGFGETVSTTGYQHYIEIGSVNGLTVDNNAFEGPMDPNYINAGLHNNVLHVDGNSSNVTFDNNILWHTESRAQTVLMQEGTMDNIEVQDNLDVEDPACETNANCYTMPFEIYAPHGLTFTHNTSVNPAWGMLLGPTCSGCYASGQNMTADHNIVAPKSGDTADSQTNYGQWSCAATCTAQDNTSADTSADTVFGAGTNVTNWTAAWQNTTWTPVSGPGYHAPPTGYYQPSGLSIAGAGYQGTIGP